jgi:sterol 3beta-glucosyltransferase
MRALFGVEGSTGDIIPFIALAQELHRYGHEVVMAIQPHLKYLPERFNLQTLIVGPDLSETYREIERLELLVASGEAVDEAYLASLWAPVVESLPETFNLFAQACGHADVLITPPGLFARTLHDLTTIAFVSVTIPYPYQQDSHGVVENAAALLNAYREQLGLPPLPPTSASANSPQLALFAMTPQALQLPVDSPSHYHIPGFFFADEEHWEPDSELLQFFDSGAPPVVVSLGSTVHTDPSALTAIFVEALQSAGCRGIIQHGWSGLAAGQQLPPDIRAVGYIPHTWLLPRAAAVIHHAGAGTTAAAFRAGIPAVCVPHVRDEFSWAQFAVQRGCAAPDSIPIRSLTAERLCAAIMEVVRTPRYAEAARTLREQIRAEQGVQKARQLIENLVSSGRVQ